MQNSDISGYRSEPLIADQEHTAPASTFTCQPGTSNSEAERSSTYTELAEPVWDVAANAKHGLRTRPLTRAQLTFVEGVVRGETHKLAYRNAYPGDTSTDASISTSASRLLRDKRVQKALREAQEADPEVLLDDPEAMKRFVLVQLLRCARTFKQEGSKIKALELIGKAAGLFVLRPEQEPTAVTADQLRKELAVHLKFVDIANQPLSNDPDGLQS